MNKERLMRKYKIVYGMIYTELILLTRSLDKDVRAGKIDGNLASDLLHEAILDTSDWYACNYLYALIDTTVSNWVRENKAEVKQMWANYIGPEQLIMPEISLLLEGFYPNLIENNRRHACVYNSGVMNAPLSEIERLSRINPPFNYMDGFMKNDLRLEEFAWIPEIIKGKIIKFLKEDFEFRKMWHLYRDYFAKSAARADAEEIIQYFKVVSSSDPSVQKVINSVIFDIRQMIHLAPPVE